MKYRIDLNNYLLFFLPIHKRKPRIIAFCKCIIKQITYSQNQFQDYKDSISEKLSYNFQVIYLERILNIKFNNGRSGIYITQGNEFDELFLFNNSEVAADENYFFNQNENAQSIYLFNKAEYASQVDFQVHIPSSLNGIIDQVKAWINFYKMAGTRYEIIQF